MQDKLLGLLTSMSYLTSAEIAEQLGEDEKAVERQLSNLRVSGKVKQFNGQYRLNYEGKKAISRRIPMQGFYSGAELKPYSGRPGAMDAFALPSLSAGKRIDRVQPFSMLAKTQPGDTAQSTRSR